MKLEKTADQSTRIAELINAGINAWLEAGKLIAAEIDKDAGFVDRFCEKFPNVSPEVVLRFEQIGRGNVYPYLLVSNAPGVRALRSMPYDAQKKYWHEPVKLVVVNGSKSDEINVDVRALTPVQVRQVFSKTGVRSASAQRAWIEDFKLRSIEKPDQVDTPWRVVGNKVVFNHACTLTQRQIANIMAELSE